MNFLHFMFQGIWTFIGMLMLIGVVLNGIASIISALRGNIVNFEPLISIKTR